MNADGSYSYTVDNTVAAVNVLKTGESLTETYIYTLTDADGDTDTATLTITVFGVNDTPQVSNDSNTNVEDQVQTGNVLANDSDPDGDELSVTAFTINGENYTPGDSASIPGIGTFTLNSDG
ncbi:Ig-like domain-containing protein, partial [Methylocucumis oryzae]